MKRALLWNLDGQIVSAVSFTQKLPEIRTKYILSQSEAGELYHYLLSGYIPRRSLQVVPGIFALEASFRRMLNDEEFTAVKKIVHTAPVYVNLTSFVCMEINCYLYLWTWLQADEQKKLFHNKVF